MHIGTLTPSQTYHFELSAQLIDRYHGVLDIYHADGCYYRALHTPNSTLALISVCNGNTAKTLDVTCLAGNPDPDLLTQITQILDAKTDFSPFYAVARQHDKLWAIIEPLLGLHHFRSETVFGALMQVIIEQQISLYAALKAQRRLAEWGDLGVTYDNKRYYAFPTPLQIAEADPLELHSILKITHRRIALMQGVAQHIIAGELDLEGLRHVDGKTAYDKLVSIKGIGHWTATWTLIRGMCCYDYVGHNDVALRSAVAHYFYDTEERVSADTVARTFEQFQPHAGIAAFYTLMRWAVERY